MEQNGFKINGTVNSHHMLLADGQQGLHRMEKMLIK